ncbi:proteasome accessory factor B [Motilibacter peucedani]|uniref:Proteasome accessory factor B n=1 Tax=Motilibacter peucedani TaxID=598650 RepID=A0A420XJI6_9ACTN|nr:WYL domain-containing protein [Motilibacter peucedani]RKS67911.1 proteasome accessory factor B [Motilibacter peucedani]
MAGTPTRQKTERLLNLLIALLATRRPLTRRELRRLVPGYPESDEAFERGFERDKDELREMGVPVETASVSGSELFEDEVGYRVRREAYALPEVRFTPEEMAVLALAARAWQSAALSGPASRALLKLQASDATTADVSIAGIEPRVGASEPAFLPLWQAVRDRRPVRFDYRSSRAGASATRAVEPWGVVSRAGRWYLVGFDRDRQDTRVFRLSRIAGQVKPFGRAGEVSAPADVDLRAAVEAVAPRTQEGTARVRLRSGSGGWLRRAATAVEPGEGFDVVEVAYADLGLLADDIAALGTAATALEPPELRAEVERRLRQALEAHEVAR